MRKYLVALFVLTAGIVVLAAGGIAQRKDTAGKPFGIDKRTPWTASRIKGSPEPPPPHRSVRAFPALSFREPVLLTFVPGTKRLVVAERAGKIFTFRNEDTCKKKELFIDLPAELKSFDRKGKIRGVSAVYGLAFHPKFEQNRYCYICYILTCKKGNEHLPDGTRVSRFRVTRTDPPRVDPASEKVLITWLEGGHNGGCLKFGPDGYLYISTGDATAPSPPDGLDTGQDLSDLLSSILRIDVDKSEQGKPYMVPSDNPFVKLAGARPEIWAYGFRNPWRMSFDRVSGDLWVGDVGWELWEMVHRVEKGGNYGWSVMEGQQPVKPKGRHGPTPIQPPVLAFPHTEAASITGGFVYRGKKYPKLYGTYICGDWETRKIWGTPANAKSVPMPVQLLAQTSQRIVAFGEDAAGEIYFLDYDPGGGIYHLVPRDEANDTSKNFPRKLSETGLFRDTARQVPMPGVLPFSINAPQWADQATAQRWAAIPGKGTVKFFRNLQPIPRSMFRSKYFFPANSVLAKTLTLEMERGNPASRRKIETQVLHFDGNEWHGYSYRWNKAQTDARLVPAAGTTATFKVTDKDAPGGWRKQSWQFFGRGQCLQCHNPWAGYNLAFHPAQLDREHDYGSVVDNQLRTLEHIDLIQFGNSLRKNKKASSAKYWKPLVNPYETAHALEKRARSYLQANCAHCHQFGAGGTATIDLRYDQPLAQMKMLNAVPVQGKFDIAGAKIVVSGDPYHSVLYYRMATPAQGRMPHIGSRLVDQRGLDLIHDWIRSLALQRPEKKLTARLLGTKNGRKRAQAIGKLLQSTSTSLQLARAVEQKQLPSSLRKEVVAFALEQPKPHIRDLFEQFVPESRKIKRLGDAIDPKIILAQTGNAGRGKKLFFSSTSQCLKCHKIGGTGVDVGPDLSKIGSKMKRAEILENILRPSKKMEPKYIVHVVVAKDGRVLTGQLVERTKEQVVLRDANAKRLQIPAAQVEQIIPQRTSLMPEGLLRDLTAQQAADLVAYLRSLK